jgi:hypothetical protein
MACVFELLTLVIFLNFSIMKKRSLTIFVLFLLILQGQTQIPHLTGEVRISIESGTFDADLMLSNLPATDNYSLVLNRGLNVEYFRDAGDSLNYGYRFEYNQNENYEGFQYHFPYSGNKGRFLPGAFRVKYTGKFPVISDTLRASDWGDWKGNIAFNGQSVRAAEQTAWYPLLFDHNTGIRHLDYTYEVRINCADCSAIFFNGSEPVKGQQATFRSDLPVPLMIFAGHFDFSFYERVGFVNSGLRPEKQETLVKLADRIIAFYEEKIEIPFGKSPLVFLNTTPLSKKNAWMFVTYPTIASVGHPGYRLMDRFDPETFQIRHDSFIATMAHEFGHYYIGNYFRPNSTLLWFFGEGLTDYLSFLAVRKLVGETFFQEKMASYCKQVADFEPIPLHKVAKAGEICEIYRYRYAPLIFLAMEREIGEEAMWNWIRVVLTSDGQSTDYAFLLSSFARAGIPQETIDYLVEQYFESRDAKQNVLAKLAG